MRFSTQLLALRGFFLAFCFFFVPGAGNAALQCIINGCGMPSVSSPAATCTEENVRNCYGGAKGVNDPSAQWMAGGASWGYGICRAYSWGQQNDFQVACSGQCPAGEVKDNTKASGCACDPATMDEIGGACYPKCNPVTEDRVGVACVGKCAENEERINGICTEKCGPLQHRDSYGFCQCPADRPLEGQDGGCLKECAPNSYRGRYPDDPDLIGDCISCLSGYEPVGPAVDGQANCQPLCGLGMSRDASGVCQCLGETEKVGLVCLPKCQGGSYRKKDGSCGCPDGQETWQGTCVNKCTGGQVRSGLTGGCYCPDARTLVDGVCVDISAQREGKALCAEGQCFNKPDCPPGAEYVKACDETPTGAYVCVTFNCKPDVEFPQEKKPAFMQRKDGTGEGPDSQKQGEEDEDGDGEKDSKWRVAVWNAENTQTDCTKDSDKDGKNDCIDPDNTPDGERDCDEDGIPKSEDPADCAEEDAQAADEKKDFCKVHPKAAACIDAEAYCKLHPKAVQCLQVDDKETDKEPVKPTEKSVSISPVIEEAGSCPAGITFRLYYYRKDITLSYEPACQVARQIRPIVLVCAWITAVYFVVGFFKG